MKILKRNVNILILFCSILTMFYAQFGYAESGLLVQVNFDESVGKLFIKNNNDGVITIGPLDQAIIGSELDDDLISVESGKTAILELRDFYELRSLYELRNFHKEIIIPCSKADGAKYKIIVETDGVEYNIVVKPVSYFEWVLDDVKMLGAAIVTVVSLIGGGAYVACKGCRKSTLSEGGNNNGTDLGFDDNDNDNDNLKNKLLKNNRRRFVFTPRKTPHLSVKKLKEKVRHSLKLSKKNNNKVINSDNLDDIIFKSQKFLAEHGNDPNYKHMFESMRKIKKLKEANAQLQKYVEVLDDLLELLCTLEDNLSKPAMPLIWALFNRYEEDQNQ